jgi:hypothetical protein
MTHSLYRAQESAPSEAILEDSRGSGKQLRIPDLRSGPSQPGVRFVDHRYRLPSSGSQPSPYRPALTHKIAVTVYLASSDDPSRVNVSRIVRLPLQRGFEQNRQFRPFQHFRANPLSANPSAFPSLTCATTFGAALASRRGATLRTNVRRSCGRSQLAVSRWRRC